MLDKAMSGGCVFDSSGGAFPDGYCVWEVSLSNPPQLISCHCREGFVCGNGPTKFDARFEGQLVRHPCQPARTEAQQQQRRH